MSNKIEIEMEVNTEEFEKLQAAAKKDRFWNEISVIESYIKVIQGKIDYLKMYYREDENFKGTYMMKEDNQEI
jgi:hypothetical protein